MKKHVIIAVFALGLFGFNANAQENHLNIGTGFSNWGIPIYVSYDFNVAENLNVVAGVSYQQKTQSYSSIGFNYKWKTSIIGINAGVQYYFDDLLELDDKFDLYGAGTLGFNIVNHSYDGPGAEPSYSGSDAGSIGIGIAAGGRFYLNDKIALNAEIGGGNVVSGLRIGVSFKM